MQIVCGAKAVSPPKELWPGRRSVLLPNTVKKGQATLGRPAATTWQPVANMTSDARIDHKDVFIRFRFLRTGEDAAWHEGVVFGRDAKEWYVEIVTQPIEARGIVVVLTDIGVPLGVDSNGVVKIRDQIGLKPP